MHKMKLFYVSLLVFALQGCKVSDKPTNEDYDDIAAGVAALVSSEQGSDTQSMQDAVALSQGDVPEALSSSNQQGNFVGTRGSLNYEYTLQCRNLAGALLDSCDESTDSAELSVSWDGTIDTARYDASVQRDGNWILSGLQGDQVLFNGEGSFYFQSSFDALFRPVSRTFIFDYLATYEDVAYDQLIRAFVDGTIVFDIRAERTRSGAFSAVEAEFNVMAVLSFDSEGNATVELDGKRRYKINTLSGEVDLQTSK